MKWKLAVAVATLSLAGCSADPAPVAKETAKTAAADLPVVGQEMQIVALGDSLFAGYGVEPGQSYPARLEAALRARGINARITNAGVSGDTTSGGLQRADFVLNSLKAPPALVIVSLGGNDMLRGLPPAETRKNLDALLAKLAARKVPVLLMGMLAAPNWGEGQGKAFNAIYPDLAKQYGAGLVPFFLEPVVGKPELVQADHIHPTAAGIDLLVGATVDQVAKALPVKSS
ncbi:MAG: arylesterase [Novosphingobium sp.]